MVKLFDESEFQLLASALGTDKIAACRDDENVIVPVSVLSDYIKSQSSIEDVEVIVPTGVDFVTCETRIIYGVNVIDYSESSNFCVALPNPPIQGKSVKIINNSGYKIRVYPSLEGGSINGVVDGFVEILPDKKVHIITCWENPNPGDWSATGVENSKIIKSGKFTIPHTNGVDTFASGVFGFVTPGGVGLSKSSGNPASITPSSSYVKSENEDISVILMKVHSNIIDNDAGFANNRIYCALSQCFVTSDNSSTAGDRIVVQFDASVSPIEKDIQKVPIGGVVNSPVKIGDSGTFFAEAYPIVGGNFSKIGTGAEFGRYYYYFKMNIPAFCKTKDYEFEFELHCI